MAGTEEELTEVSKWVWRRGPIASTAAIAAIAVCNMYPRELSKTCKIILTSLLPEERQRVACAVRKIAYHVDLIVKRMENEE